MGKSNEYSSLRAITTKAVQATKVVAERAILASQIVKHTQALPPNYTQGEKFGYIQLVPDYTNSNIVRYHMDKANTAEAKMQVLMAQSKANTESIQSEKK